GDLQRILIYPERGFMIPQEVPANVREAFDVLVAAGYRQHLLPETP
ncbi:MAG TPA: YdcF family protein, partial [Bacillota bacterium]|nr:YdcF family protein [Bacillota bacterium]